MRILGISLLIASLAGPTLAAPAPVAHLAKASVRMERPRHQPVVETMIDDRGLTALLSTQTGGLQSGQGARPVPKMNNRR